MAKYSKYNMVYRLQKWMDSVPGQTFLNYAYNWGASIVILGTLFKLLHLSGANLMLCVGMGTEVFVFFISAFDRPFDKTADGWELPTHVNEEEETEGAEEEENTVVGGGSQVGGGTIIIGGGAPASGVAAVEGVSGGAVSGGVVSGGIISGGGVISGGVVSGNVDGGMPVIPQPVSTSDMVEATNNYVEELKKLTEMLAKVSEQSHKLTTDSEEMENLNRTLTGICKVYEMQLKSASSQIGTIDEINDQTRKMANQIEQLNVIYARMIEAMTTNMPGAAKAQV